MLLKTRKHNSAHQNYNYMLYTITHTEQGKLTLTKLNLLCFFKRTFLSTQQDYWVLDGTDCCSRKSSRRSSPRSP